MPLTDHYQRCVLIFIFIFIFLFFFLPDESQYQRHFQLLMFSTTEYCKLLLMSFYVSFCVFYYRIQSVIINVNSWFQHFVLPNRFRHYQRHFIFCCILYYKIYPRWSFHVFQHFWLLNIFRHYQRHVMFFEICCWL